MPKHRLAIALRLVFVCLRSLGSLNSVWQRAQTTDAFSGMCSVTSTAEQFGQLFVEMLVMEGQTLSHYRLEEAEGQKALVLELVEGPTLADRIKQGPIPIDEALPIAKQIAEALDAAHAGGPL